MAFATYTVKRGDSLWKIASGGCGKEYAASISGSTIEAKINTLVQLNNIKNRNLIYVNQVLKLSGTSSSSSTTTTTTTVNPVPVITAFGLQSEDTTGRAMYVAWSYNRDHVKNYKVRWVYYADGLWQSDGDQETPGAESFYCNDTFSAPDRATKVKVAVCAVSQEKDNDGNLYWYDVPWSAEKIYDFADNPPFPPAAPTIKIEDYTLTASIENIKANELNAEYVDFEIIKNNVSSLGSYSAKINTATNYVSYVHTVDAGAEYKVRARSKKGSRVSGWSDFSPSEGTKPSVPSAITTCMAKSYSDDEVSAYLEWTAVNNAETYDIEHTTNKNYFDGSDGTDIIEGIEFTHHEITSLELGKEYFFRVRAANKNGKSDWSEIKSLVLGTTPAAPTTWSSTTTAVVGEPLNLYWIHNSEDSSSQTYAELRLYVDDVLQVPDITIRNSTDEDEKDKTSVYALDTTNYPEGTKIKWQVRTAGITKTYGDWSVERVVDIYAKPTLELAVTTQPEGAGEFINILTSFPFYIYALPGPKTQAPIGYHLKVTANEYYETIDDTGTSKMVNEGEAIYSKYFDTNNALIVEMSADNLDIVADVEYTITCSVTMNSGLSAETSHDIKADWDEVAYNINANVTIDHETLTALVVPYSEDENGSLVEDLTLSVYRREFDGSFKELAKNIPNTNSVTVSDPHPALDYARYRIVGETISTGSISYYDLPGIKIGGNAVIIQWNEDWSTFDASDEYSVEKPSWSGSMLTLPYNIDTSDSHEVDSEMVKYIGREHPVAYYGTQLGHSATWNMEIPKDDKDTLYAIRRLAKWAGNVYVREPSGSGYWANIKVSYNQTHKEVTIPITFTITRVEGGI